LIFCGNRREVSEKEEIKERMKKKKGIKNRER